MARLKKNRNIQMAPVFKGFKPQGLPYKMTGETHIDLEEYEALKLCDYELLTQAEAAKMMNISRPTFTRIYENVRRKIARAFIEGTCIHFGGGCVDIAMWYHCAHCKITFTLTDVSLPLCPFCKSVSLPELSDK
jgi:uncharacterized protein